MNQETKTCQNCKAQFTIEPEDFSFYEKINVPPPTFCPDCRLQRRMIFRNERSLYRDVCDLCGKKFISMYSPDKPFKVYCKECWYSDNWDPMRYGRDYNWSKPFFKQFQNLMEAVPRIGIIHIGTNINSDYANIAAGSKNAYLSQSVTGDSENIYYSRFVDKCKDIFDCLNIQSSEQCYEIVDGLKNNNCSFLVRCRECISSRFLFDCVNCQDCFMSSNLRNKRFMIRNMQYGRESYAEEMKKILTGKNSTLTALKTEHKKLIQRSLHKFANIIKSNNCAGDNIHNSKNTLNCFDSYEDENVRWCNRFIYSKDSQDVLGGVKSELIFEVLMVGSSYDTQFALFGDAMAKSQYVDSCHNISSVLGCIALQKKQYCIFNKQYTKDEYDALVPKIIEHMNSMPYLDTKGRVYGYGEFFPVELSPFAYNETIAQEYFPLAKDEALKKGFIWRDPDASPYTPTMNAADLPDDLAETPDSITEEIISCAECGKVYKILTQELVFLKHHIIALPRLCIECRHKRRFYLRNPLKLWRRQCMCAGQTSYESRIMRHESGFTSQEYQNTTPHFHGTEKCPNEFETSYAPDRPEIVYCEQCYQAEVA